jgi:hypothetical protein
MSNQRCKDQGQRAYARFRIQGRSEPDIAAHDMQAEPVIVQLGDRLIRTAPLPVEELRHIEHGIAFKHVIDRSRQFMR